MIYPDHLGIQINYYHVDEGRGCEVIPDSHSEWDDALELVAQGALSNATIPPDRRALIFPDPLQARDALEELRQNEVLA